MIKEYNKFNKDDPTSTWSQVTAKNHERVKTPRDPRWKKMQIADDHKVNAQ